MAPPTNTVSGTDGRLYLAFYTKHSVFSNHFLCEFSFAGITFTSSEQLYFYLKALHFGDGVAATKILNSCTPTIAKRLSRGIKNLDPEEWKTFSVSYMYKSVKAKFNSDIRLRDALVATGDTVLVEASPTDTFWGVGLPTTSNNISDPTKWRGKNTLGQVLMQLRTEFTDQ